MKYSKANTILILLGLMLVAVGCNSTAKQDPPRTTENTQDKRTAEPPALPVEPQQIVQTLQFSTYNPVFRFQGQVPQEWRVEYVPEIESINIYNPTAPGSTPREQSQIFIRYFTASKFLTLSTVEILQRIETEINKHAAVEYEIKKKPNVPNFPHQPPWRNGQHKLTDIRFSNSSPTTFFVFAYNPALLENLFKDFINSIIFHNGQSSFEPPINRALERVTKKPFGLKVSPQNSPVSPERFSGYHNAVDFEAFSEEADIDVPVNALCGGKLLQKKTSSGYGGVAVQECLLGDQPITVVYGHMRLSSITESVGSYLAPGQNLGALGAGFTKETDSERKHLHLGIHKGATIDIRGYVPKQSDLQSWLDPLTLFPK